jgi:5-methylcytosine-specific restriction endonuclease McrA
MNNKSHSLETRKKIGYMVSMAMKRPEVFEKISKIRTIKNRPVGAVDTKICICCKKEYSRPHHGAWKPWMVRKFCGLKCKTNYTVLHGLQKGENNPRFGKNISEETRDKMKSYVGEQRYNYKGGYQNRLLNNKKYRARRIGALGSHTLDEWEKLKMRYDYMCLCCKRQEPDITLTVDHIRPLMRGGSDYITNIQPLCKSCNCKKYTNTIDYSKLTILDNK